ncbi:hypothetical protein EVAR_13533_1 [Eumeta japonica]|uniref:Uncharacterized protein n=1 Tax=Eumeta variegata TaxID=151549 RepID=A0A4C1U8J7_EUMVA|nr:hypothetical protein EVAR_13533_1 [Eumeta japonica]
MQAIKKQVVTAVHEHSQLQGVTDALPASWEGIGYPMKGDVGLWGEGGNTGGSAMTKEEVDPGALTQILCAHINTFSLPNPPVRLGSAKSVPALMPSLGITFEDRPS